MIPIFRPTIKRRDMDSVLTCMVSDRIGAGILGDALVGAVSEYLSLAGGVALSSYYHCIVAAFDALGCKPADKVVVSALSPSCYLEALRERGLVPIIVDVEADTGCLAASSLVKALDQGPKALLVHYSLGYIADMEELSRLGVPLIEDLSQGLGGNWGTRRCGSYGDLVIVSLEPESIVTCGQGGLLLSRDNRLVRQLGSSQPVSSLLLSDLNASLGLSQMREIESYIATRKEIARVFSRGLMRSSHKTLVQKGEGDNVFYSFPVILESGMKAVRQYARKYNIETIQAFSGSICAIENTNSHFPNARQLMLRCLLFPCYPMLGKRNVDTISKVLTTLP